MGEIDTTVTDAQLLEALKKERAKFTQSDDALVKAMVDQLIERGVYPKETVEGNPSTVYQMVEGWGAYWHKWDEPLSCKFCNADLRDVRTGPPFKREIIICNRQHQRTGVQCPDCKREW
jgi:hypothetical protein